MIILDRKNITEFFLISHRNPTYSVELLNHQIAGRMLLSVIQLKFPALQNSNYYVLRLLQKTKHDKL